MNDGRRASRDESRARALVRDELCANARKTLPCRRPPSSSSSSSSSVVLRRRPPSRTFPSLGAPSSSRCGEGVTDRPTPLGRDSSFEDPHDVPDRNPSPPGPRTPQTATCRVRRPPRVRGRRCRRSRARTRRYTFERRGDARRSTDDASLVRRPSRVRGRTRANVNVNGTKNWKKNEMK